MPILLLILCWYISYLQMYLEKFLNIYFHEQMFFQIFVAKGDICPQDIEVLGWCPGRPVLPHGEKVPL